MREGVIIVVYTQHKVSICDLVREVSNPVAELILFDHFQVIAKNFYIPTCFCHQYLVPLVYVYDMVKSILRNFLHLLHSLIFQTNSIHISTAVRHQHITIPNQTSTIVVHISVHLSQV